MFVVAGMCLVLVFGVLDGIVVVRLLTADVAVHSRIVRACCVVDVLLLNNSHC